MAFPELPDDRRARPRRHRGSAEDGDPDIPDDSPSDRPAAQDHPLGTATRYGASARRGTRGDEPAGRRHRAAVDEDAPDLPDQDPSWPPRGRRPARTGDAGPAGNGHRRSGGPPPNGAPRNGAAPNGNGHLAEGPDDRNGAPPADRVRDAYPYTGAGPDDPRDRPSRPRRHGRIDDGAPVDPAAERRRYRAEPDEDPTGAPGRRAPGRPDGDPRRAEVNGYGPPAGNGPPRRDVPPAGAARGGAGFRDPGPVEGGPMNGGPRPADDQVRYSGARGGAPLPGWPPNGAPVNGGPVPRRPADAGPMNGAPGVGAPAHGDPRDPDPADGPPRDRRTGPPGHARAATPPGEDAAPRRRRTAPVDGPPDGTGPRGPAGETTGPPARRRRLDPDAAPPPDATSRTRAPAGPEDPATGRVERARDGGPADDVRPVEPRRRPGPARPGSGPDVPAAGALQDGAAAEPDTDEDDVDTTALPTTRGRRTPRRGADPTARARAPGRAEPPPGEDAFEEPPDDPDETSDDTDGPRVGKRSGPVGIGGRISALTSRRSRRTEDGEKKPTSFWRELPLLIGVALVLTFLIQTFVAKVFVIPSGSMETTLNGCTGCDNDRVLVDKVTYNFTDISPGDVVVFRGPDSWSSSEYELEQTTNPVLRGLQMAGSLIGFAPPDEKDFVKRVIATGGQTVACCDALNQVMVDGQPLDEPYIYYLPEAGPARQIPFGPITVPQGEMWMMGDSRNNSADSRAAGHGPVPEENVIGKVRLIVLPFDRFGGVEAVNPQTTATAAGDGGLPQGTALALGMMGTFPFALGRRRSLLRHAEEQRFLPVVRRPKRWRRSP